ncbi:MAG TPA: hypothetical protein PLF01_05480 [Alphaproteobacteria bacterium]|nr:hypothetical protein [Alphaproteobacteria bacterium]
MITVLMVFPVRAHALEYTHCNDPKESLVCYIALEKLRTIDNPLTGKKFFDDGIHYEGSILFIYPDLHIAVSDLDDDGYNEIIVKVPELDELITGLFCKPVDQCPHFIIQDRNVGETSNLENFRAMGPIYTYGIGLSTDEVVNGYRSLRAYKDNKIKDFNVYQYDKKSDDYFNVSIPK